MNATRLESSNEHEARPRTVAIVGSHPRTRELAPYSDPAVEIWMFNSVPLSDWCKRVSAVFELHKPEEYRSMPDWWRWLRDNRTTRVYMQEEDYQAPLSRKYPLAAICGRFLKNLQRGEGPNLYFTSSVCYALALAAFQGFERIELYGIEMETNTEYIYQREGVGLWIGICLSLGINVWIPDDCAMLNAPLYGYDQDYSGITREELEDHMHTLMTRREEAKKKVDTSRGYLRAIAGETEAARNKGVPAPQIAATLGQKFAEAQLALERAQMEWAGLEAQISVDSYWITKLEKHMIARGTGQEVMALNAVKLT